MPKTIKSCSNCEVHHPKFLHIVSGTMSSKFLRLAARPARYTASSLQSPGTLIRSFLSADLRVHSPPLQQDWLNQLMEETLQGTNDWRLQVSPSVSVCTRVCSLPALFHSVRVQSDHPTNCRVGTGRGHARAANKPKTMDGLLISRQSCIADEQDRARDLEGIRTLTRGAWSRIPLHDMHLISEQKGRQPIRRAGVSVVHWTHFQDHFLRHWLVGQQM